MLNEEGYNQNGATGSAVDYFRASSFNQYNPTFDVYGPYTLSQTMSYYGRDVSEEGDDAHAVEMIVEACSLAAADGVDFSNYDTDNDGVIDFVFVFYAGYSQAEGASSNTIWPHSWEVRDTATYHGTWWRDIEYETPADYSNYEGTADDVTFNGKRLYTYACASELKGVSGSYMTGIGTFTHEFSHVLGLPDLYATNYASHKTMGEWDILDAGPYNNDGCTPPIYSAYERFFMGWMTPTLLTESNKYTLEHIETSNKAFMITSSGTHNMNGADPSPSEFYLLENRQQTGWDTYIPGHGMLVTRVNYDPSKWNENTVNNDGSDMGVDIIEADGISSVTYSDYGYADTGGKQGDVFPTALVTSFVPYTQYPVRCIQEWDDVISFKFMVDEDDCGFPTCLKESFAGCTARANTNVVNMLDTYCDLQGWTGTGTITCNDGSLRVGTSSGTSSITTPAIGMSGDINVVISAASYNSSWGFGSNAIISLSLTGGGTLSTSRITLSTDADIQTLTISNCTADTKLTMQSSGRFILYSFNACDPATAVDEIAYDDVYIRSCDGTLHVSNIGADACIAVYSATGKLVDMTTTSDSYQRRLMRGMYIVYVNGHSHKIII